jgi:predicted S18 family serine protease
VEKKAQELSTLLQNKDAKPEDIKAALAAYRDARTKAKAELEKAQKDLRDLLTVRQEAVLVSMGTLD